MEMKENEEPGQLQYKMIKVEILAISNKNENES